MMLFPGKERARSPENVPKGFGPFVKAKYYGRCICFSERSLFHSDPCKHKSDSYWILASLKVCLRWSSEGLFDTLCQPRLAPRNSESFNTKVKQGSTSF